jgi:hypothetical protein
MLDGRQHPVFAQMGLTSGLLLPGECPRQLAAGHATAAHHRHPELAAARRPLVVLLTSVQRRWATRSPWPHPRDQGRRQRPVGSCGGSPALAARGGPASERTAVTAIAARKRSASRAADFGFVPRPRRDRRAPSTFKSQLIEMPQPVGRYRREFLWTTGRSKRRRNTAGSLRST